jgi:hypothetical protein
MNTDRQIARPDIIIADVGPLIQLAQAGRLHLLHQVGRRIVIPDMVAHEVMEDLSTPGVQDLQDWIDAGQAEGGDGPVSIETTEVGRAFYAARKAEPDFRWPKAAELLIVGWLGERVEAAEHPVLVIYESRRVPYMVGDADVAADIKAMTTRAFLALAKGQESAAAAELS